jgi:hypothetical protein
MSALGTELKINVHVEPIGGIRMSEYDFTCVFYVYKNKCLVINKRDMTKVDDDNYIANVDTTKIGAGCLKMRFEAEIPDSDINDGFRKEVELVDLNIPIIAV